MKKVKLTKLSDCENPLHPNHIPVSYEKIGYMDERPKVGESFWVSDLRTSTVMEIIDENTFKTKNSIYRFEVID